MAGKENLTHGDHASGPALRLRRAAAGHIRGNAEASSRHNRDLAKAAASILGDEAMHWAILRNALGEVPVPSAFVS